MSKRKILAQRSSSISFPNEALARTTPILPMQLPNEIILAIVAPLAFDDLKSARLLSKAWSPCASVYLFANLSISPNQEDLEVFEAITQHSQLSECVCHLWYIASEFLLHLSKRQYSMDVREKLWQQSISLHPQHLQS